MHGSKTLGNLVTIGACLYAVRDILARIHQDREATRELERRRLETQASLENTRMSNDQALQVREQDYADLNLQRQTQLTLLGY